jgi:hypothetical protein
VPGAAPGHGGINHHIGWCEASWVSSDLDSFQVDHDLAGRDPDRHTPAGKARRDRVVDIAHPDEPILLHPDLGVPVDVGQRISKRRQEAAFGGQRVAHPAAHSPVVAPEGHALGPGVMLGLQVVEAGEAAKRQEGALQGAVGPLDLALGLGLARLQHDQAHAQVPAQGRDLRVQDGLASHASGHDPGVVVDHHGLGHPPRRTRQPTAACRKSAIVLEKLNPQAWAAECGSVVTHP